MQPPRNHDAGRGLAPLVRPRPSEVQGLEESVRAALREVEELADKYAARGALLGYDSAIRAAWIVSNRLRVDIHVGGPPTFEVSTR